MIGCIRLIAMFVYGFFGFLLLFSLCPNQFLGKWVLHLAAWVTCILFLFFFLFLLLLWRGKLPGVFVLFCRAGMFL